MRIIEAGISEWKRIREINLAAFGDEEGESVAALAGAMLRLESTPRILHLVAEVDGALVGHVAFSPVGVGGESHGLGSILAPLAVEPDYQKRGVGSALVREGLQKCREQGDRFVFVYGDPNYYGRFGFSAGEWTEAFRPPCPAQYPFGWQAQAFLAGESPAEPTAIECVEPLNKPDLW